MTGAELAIGGWFASAVINKLVELGHSHLSDSNNLHSNTTKMLKNLEVQLPRIQSVIEAAEKRQITNNRGLATWLEQLKDAAYEAEDVLDDFESKKIRESIKGKGKVTEIASSSGKKVKNLFSTDKYFKKLESVVDNLDKLCMGDFIKTLQLTPTDKGNEHLANLGNNETTAYLSPGVPIFGRDEEIQLISDMILNVLYGDFYKKALDDLNLQHGEGSSTLSDERSKTFLTWGMHGQLMFVRAVKKSDVPEQTQKGLLVSSESDLSDSDSSESEISMFSETFRKGDASEQSQKGLLDWSESEISMFPETFGKGDASEQSQKGLLDWSESEISMFPETFSMLDWSDTVTKGDAPEQSQNIVETVTTLVQPQSTSNRKLAVIPIVGPGGVGKTTIAKKIYNDESVKDYFDLRAWVYVSENYDAKKIMQVMLCSFKEYGTEPESTIKCPEIWDILEKRLIETIKNQRFLLILDDLTNRTVHIWSKLWPVLYSGEVGSVVVVTTQNKSIADTVGTLPKVTLDVLKPDSFWKLFEYYAFGGFKFGDHPHLPPAKQEELKRIGEEIVKKLHGLPLAGKVIGTMLSNKLEIEFWEDICGSDWWNIEGAHEILQSIGVSYNYLNPELKHCFVFCSIFPKNYVFKRERIVQMWIAQGFIQPSKEETRRLAKGEIRLEDIGRKWFGKLVDISFFQPTVIDGKYVMHDLVRDLAIAFSSDEFSFVKSHDKNLPFSTRHLGVDCDNSEVEWKCENSTRVRTVIFFGNWTNGSDDKSISNFFAKSNGLRVLDISHNVPKKNAPINAACRLLHLRVLDLSFTGIVSIADEICALCHLQVLDVRGCNFKSLPEGMNQLINLRHLYASSDTISLVTNIGKLTKLQELVEFSGLRISELEYMNEISGHLLLRNLEDVPSKEAAAKSQLDKKMYLQSLEFEGFCRSAILDSLKPPRNIEILKVDGGCRSLPSWLSSAHDVFNNLKVIHVSNFWLKSLPAFGKLRLLEILSIDNFPLIEKVGSELYGNSEVVFPSLKELTFSGMPKWSDWSGAEATQKIFPHLQKLHLEDCNNLNNLPTNSFTSSVVELILSLCRSLGNIETILQGMSSLARLTINGCHPVVIYCTLLKSLEVMHLTDTTGLNQVRFVGGFKSLVKLRKLVIKDFFKVMQTYEKNPYNEIYHAANEEQCFQFLSYLHLCQCSPRVGRTPSLRTLLIENSRSSCCEGYQEIWFSQLKSLERLEFRNCKKLTHLPSSLHLLTSLKKLRIYSCPELRSLPAKGLPKNLAELSIEQCPDLLGRCQPNKGDDWRKISHIPYVHLTGPYATICKGKKVTITEGTQT